MLRGLFLWTIVLTALLVAPALADDDPFRTAAPPAPPVAPKPAPRPQPRAEPVMVPQPPPSRFSADYVARIKQAAAAQQVGVPAAVVFREDSTPVEFRNYLGAWGPGTWVQSGTRYLLVIEAVDPDGSVDLTRSWSDSTKGFYKLGSEKLRAKLARGKLLVDFWYTGADDPKGHRGHQEFTLIANGTLRGTSGSGNYVDLPHLP